LHSRPKTGISLSALFFTVVLLGGSSPSKARETPQPAAESSPAAAACEPGVTDDFNQYFISVPARPLTSGEIRLVGSIVGDQIDLRRVRIYVSRAADRESSDARTFSENCIEFYDGRRFGSADFSKDPDELKFGNFVHEMTHVWQNQAREAKTASSRAVGDYLYELKSNSRFIDYGDEQQAAIVEDYPDIF
jgi:hypothetical protein